MPEAHSQAKLTPAKIAKIRRHYAAGGVSLAELAQQYGVSKPAIWKYVRNKSRKDAPGPTEPARPRTQMTDPLARELREAYAAGGVSIAKLARRYGFGQELISKVLKGQTWKNAGGPLLHRDQAGPLRGEAHHNSRLTDAQAEAIRQAYAAGGVSQSELARRFGVSPATISLTVRRKRRKDAAGPTVPVRPLAKLTDDIVETIRHAYDAGGVTCSELARRYGVSETAVAKAIRGETWKRAGGPIHAEIGRPSGEDHPRARLTNADAEVIRHAYIASGVSRAELARRYGVSEGTIKNVLADKTYKSDPGRPARLRRAILRQSDGSYKVRGKIKRLSRKAQRELIDCLIRGQKRGPDTSALRMVCGDYLNVLRGIRTDPDWASAILPPDRSGRGATHWRVVYD